MATKPQAAPLASDLRVVLCQLIRRLRSEHRFSLSHGSVLGRLDRDGAKSARARAYAERVPRQSMAQTVADLESDGLVARAPDPDDGRRALVSVTGAGLTELREDRLRREGWLVSAIEELPAEDQATVERAIVLLRRLADAEV